MLLVLAMVGVILRRALTLTSLAEACAARGGPVAPEAYALYRSFEPWYLAMRLLAVVAVLLAVFRPA
jgi:hypothetical protein